MTFMIFDCGDQDQGCSLCIRAVGEEVELFQLKAVFHLLAVRGDYLQHVLRLIPKIMCSRVTHNAKNVKNRELFCRSPATPPFSFVMTKCSI